MQGSVELKLMALDSEFQAVMFINSQFYKASNERYEKYIDSDLMSILVHQTSCENMDN